MLPKTNKLQRLLLSLLLVGLFALTSCEPDVDPTDSNDTTPSITDTSSTDSTSNSDDDFIYADYYNGYYEGLTSWENGEDLKEQLYTIINDNVTFINFDTSSQKWEVNQLADETIDNLDRVNLVYAAYQPLKTYTSTSTNKGWQREHAFCQSLGNFDVSNTRPTSEEELVKQMKSDFHNLFASDGRINNSRGNKNLGNVDESMGTIVYPFDEYGTETGVRAIESVGDVSVSIFEPRDEEKGMLARAIFYMATRFEDLSVVEGVSEVRSKSHGMLSDLLTWNIDDVTLREYKHNEGVYAFQNNRNPYVDYPGLVDYVFGNKQNESGSLEKMRPSYYDVVLENETKEAKDERNLALYDLKIHYQVGEKFNKGADIKARIINQNLSQNSPLAVNEFTCSLNDNYEFVISDLGFKEITVTHSSYQVKYEIEIEADPSLLATYQYVLIKDDPFDDLRKAGASAAGQVHDMNLGGLNFNFYFESGKISSFQEKSGLGRQFGTKDESIKSMYLETTNSFSYNLKTKVNEIYIVATTAATIKSAQITVSIGSFTFPIQTMVIGTPGNNTLYSFTLEEGIFYEGKVKIAFSGFTGGYLAIKRFAINAT